MLTPTISPETRLRYQCLEVTSALPTGAILEGRIVLDGQFNDYLLDVKTGDKIPLAQETNIDLFYGTVSPDGKWLAYLQDTYDQSRSKILKKELVVATGAGQLYKTIPWEDNWLYLIQWLDNQRLVIIRNRNTGNEPYKLDSVIVLNPFTAQQQEFLPDYPNIYTILKPTTLWGYYDAARTIYDPTLTWVVYAGAPTAYSNTTLVTIELENTQTGKTEAQLFAKPLLYGSVPQWSPDGEQFVTHLDPTLNGDLSIRYVGGFELYSVTRDGQVSRLTYLTTQYIATEYNDSWSPDGRRIAFWLTFAEKDKDNSNLVERLAVLDTTTGEVTDYCLLGETYGSDLKPIWSPNGQYLVVRATNGKYANHTFAILVDIVNNWAAQIAEDVYPVGWMVNP